MFKIFLILSLATLTLALSDDLRCYDCDPNKAGKCEEPLKSNNKETLCRELLDKDQQSVGVKVFSRGHFERTTLEPTKSANVAQNYVYDCISLKYVPNPGSDLQTFPEGIYRGCVIRQGEESDPCKVATENIQVQGNGTVTACSSCKDTLCNEGVPKEDGTGGAASFSLSAIAMLCALVCFYLADF